MDGEISRDIPALVAVVRTQARWRIQHPDVELDVEKCMQRLGSEPSRQLARALLGVEVPSDPTVRAKAAAIRKLALGD
jgi:hypothetical protein